MIKGLYSAASAMLVGMNRQTLLSHNVANLDTPGFKQVLATWDEFMHAPVIQPPESATGANNKMYKVGSLGLGTENTADFTDFTQGALLHTGQPLDFAISGPGFFRIKTPDGERYTRDGRFNRDVQGQLVTVDGYQVLDESGQPIIIEEDAEISVSGDGTLFSNGEQYVKLGLASFANPETELTRDTPNTFTAAEAPTGTELGEVVLNYVESSNANAAQLMTQMVQVGRYYEAAQKMVQTQDELLARSIATLGKF